MIFDETPTSVVAVCPWCGSRTMTASRAKAETAAAAHAERCQEFLPPADRAAARRAADTASRRRRRHAS